MTLEDAVKDIIVNFSSGKIFDSHVVIDELRSNSKYSTIYLHGIGKNEDITNYHKRIAEIIRDSGLVTAVQDGNNDMMINTRNVHGCITPNHVWRRN